MASKLSQLKKTAAKKPAAASKTSVREITIDAALQPAVRAVCELGYLLGEIKSPQDQKLKGVKKNFFLIWTREFWASKTLPANFAVVLPKLDDKGKPTVNNDTRCVFQLKFRTDGVKTKLPNDDESLPDDVTTVQELIVKTLQTPVVGISEANARKFVDSEIDVRDEVEFSSALSKSFGQLLEIDLDGPGDIDDATRLNAGIANKIFDTIRARTKSKTGKVQLPQWTDEETAGVLVTVQNTYLKSGMLERVLEYCETIEQLQGLLTWCNVTLQVADFDYGMSDEPAVKAERLKEVVGIYLVAAE